MSFAALPSRREVLAKRSIEDQYKFCIIYEARERLQHMMKNTDAVKLSILHRELFPMSPPDTTSFATQFQEVQDLMASITKPLVVSARGLDSVNGNDLRVLSLLLGLAVTVRTTRKNMVTALQAYFYEVLDAKYVAAPATRLSKRSRDDSLGVDVSPGYDEANSVVPQETSSPAKRTSSARSPLHREPKPRCLNTTSPNDLTSPTRPQTPPTPTCVPLSSQSTPPQITHCGGDHDVPVPAPASPTLNHPLLIPVFQEVLGMCPMATIEKIYDNALDQEIPNLSMDAVKSTAMYLAHANSVVFEGDIVYLV
eukprot:PhF_6_TR35799/c0_g1_i1/m.52030